jgi:hypothetical protein
MRLVMCLLVRDEADIVRENLAFHFSQGVDFAIVMDNRSKDGTTAILREYEKRGRIRLIAQPGVYDQGPWVTQMARLAIEEHEADWVLPNDADEFWLPREGTLNAILERVPPEVGALVCHRATFVPTADDGRPWWERMTLREGTSLNLAGNPVPPKIVHRAAPGLVIPKGNHRREPPTLGETRESDEIEVLHFQLRTYEQFEHAVIVRGRSVKRAERPDQRFHRLRRREFEIWRDGGLPAYYAKPVRTAPGEDVIRDNRLRDHLSKLGGSRRDARFPGRAAGAANAVRSAPRRLRSLLRARASRTSPPAPFVVGVPRSGTTLARLMLDSHPELAIPAETHFIPNLVARWRELEGSDAGVDERVANCLELITSHPRFGDLDVEAGELEEHLAKIRSPGLPNLARCVHVVYASGRGAKRWGDKTPGYLVKMRRIAKVLPEARFVHVIRDGRDVAVSMAGVSWATDDVAVAARRWKRRIRTARRHARRLPPGTYTEVRYEDLVSDAEPELRKVAAFAGLGWDSAMLDYHADAAERMKSVGRDIERARGGTITAAERRSQHALVAEPLRRDRIGRWRAEMDPEDLRRFEEVAGDLLEELGYPIGTVAPARA